MDATETDAPPPPPPGTTGEAMTTTSTTGVAPGIACVDAFLGSEMGPAVLVRSLTADLGNDYDGCDIVPGLNGPDYVVGWKAPFAGDFTFSLEGSQFDSVLSLALSNCTGGSLVCNDDCIGLDAVVSWPMDADQWIYIVIESLGGELSEFTLSISEGGAVLCG